MLLSNPVGVIAIGNPHGDGTADSPAVDQAREDLYLILLDLHALPAAIPLLPPG